MKIAMLKLATVSCVFALASPSLTLAGDEAAGASPSVFVPSFAVVAATSEPGADVLSNANTDRVVRILNSGRAFCASLGDSAYAVDCLAERMEAAAMAMPETGDYAEARTALRQGAAKLKALAAANADPELPRAVARQPREGGIRTSRALVPVRKDRLAAVAVQAEQIIAETETLLLRSSEASTARKVHYSRIAAAVDSNKVLLRSI